MSDFFEDPNNPERPQHPDFWKLSEIMLEADRAAFDGRLDLELVISEVVDIESVSYLSFQRGLRALIEVYGEENLLQDAEQLVLLPAFGAMWLEGFTIGAKFATREENE